VAAPELSKVTACLFDASAVLGIDIGLTGGFELRIDESVLLGSPLLGIVSFDVLDPAFDPLEASLTVSFLLRLEGVTRV
jgi:hypothetical protein